MTMNAEGRVVRVSGVTVDITDRKEAEERQALLAREVDHRARNALAVTQSIVHLTRASNIKGYIAAVNGRIGALSRAHALLSESRWQGADLATLIDDELAPYGISGAAKIEDTHTSDNLRGPSTVARARGLYLVVNADFATSQLPFTVAGLPR